VLTSEVTSAAYYAERLTRPTWPGGGASGVTIGIGEDLGQMSVAQLHADWDGYLRPGVLARLAACCGVAGEAAERLARQVEDIEVSYELAVLVFRRVRLPQFIRTTWQTFAHCDELPADAFGALVDLVFNRGPALEDAPGDTRESRREMREIATLMRMQHFDLVPRSLRSMKRLWPEGSGLVKRREAEAVLFERALGTG